MEPVELQSHLTSVSHPPGRLLLEACASLRAALQALDSDLLWLACRPEALVGRLVALAAAAGSQTVALQHYIQPGRWSAELEDAAAAAFAAAAGAHGASRCGLLAGIWGSWTAGLLCLLCAAAVCGGVRPAELCGTVCIRHVILLCLPAAASVPPPPVAQACHAASTATGATLYTIQPTCHTPSGEAAIAAAAAVWKLAASPAQQHMQWQMKQHQQQQPQQRQHTACLMRVAPTAAGSAGSRHGWSRCRWKS